MLTDDWILAGHHLELSDVTRGNLPPDAVQLTLTGPADLPDGLDVAVNHMADLLADLPARLPGTRFSNGAALTFTSPPRLQPTLPATLHATLGTIGYYAKSLAAGNMPPAVAELLHATWDPAVPAPDTWPAVLADHPHLTHPNAGLSGAICARDTNGTPHLVLARRSTRVAVNPGVIVPSFSEGIEPIDTDDLAAAVRRGIAEEVGNVPCDPDTIRLVATYRDSGASRGHGLLCLVHAHGGLASVLAARNDAPDADETTASFGCPLTVDGIADLLLEHPWGTVWAPTVLLLTQALTLAHGSDALDALDQRLVAAGWAPGYRTVEPPTTDAA